MKVLVDTSVWIRFLAGRLDEDDSAALRSLIGAGAAGAHELVHGELLIGDKGGRSTFLQEYTQISFAPRVAHPEVVTFVTKRRLHGRGAGWIDVHILASTIVAGWKLWTLDPRLRSLAAECHVSFR